MSFLLSTYFFSLLRSMNFADAGVVPRSWNPLRITVKS